MKLEFKKDFIPQDLLRELELDSYLNFFEFETPFYSNKILRPLSEQEAKARYLTLKSLDSKVQKTELQNILEVIQNLPQIDFIEQNIWSGQWDLAQLHLLSLFLKELNKLNSIWPEFLSQEFKWTHFEQMQVALNKIWNLSAGQFILTEDDFSLLNQIQNIDVKIKIIIADLEARIENQCHLKMYYPFPLLFQEKPSEHILNNSDLVTSFENSKWRIQFKIPIELEQLNLSKECLIEKLNDSHSIKISNFQNKICEIRQELINSFNLLKEYVFLFSLVRGIKKHNLSFPEITPSESKIRLEFSNLRFPALENKMKDEVGYQALTGTFLNQATLLYGSNMSGKTTLLKTLMFHLYIIKFGLPVPAEMIKLHFPNHIYFHQQSAGSFRKNLSGFTEELTFLNQDFKKSDYVFSDELIHSTHSKAAEDLTRIYLDYFSDKNIFFVGSTHLLNLLETQKLEDKNRVFYKINDFFQPVLLDINSKKDFLHQTSLKPFLMALDLSPNDDLRQIILKYIKHIKD